MERLDPFFKEQPPLKFIDDLKQPYYTKKPEGFGKREPEASEADCRGIYVSKRFPEGEELLETAYFDFDRFTELFGIAGERFPISIIKADMPKFEAYRIKSADDGITVEAGDTEGVRRALVYIEDEFSRRCGAYFPKDEIYREPVMHTRITRGFFSPTNRPPLNGDELFDDIDYYPDEYLNRLAHDGTNAIWIYTSFRALMRSEIFPEYGEGCERRMNKLRAVVDKCLRYGIKTYVFAMEPQYLLDEMAKAHPEVVGYFDDRVNSHSVCLSTEKGRAYILEATEKLFREVPNLGGYMGITMGERLTHCASTAKAIFKKCPRCSKRPIGVMLAEAVNLIREGMRRAGTGAQYISWTYGHRSWEHDDIREYVRNADSDIMLMQNFEEIAYPEQLGKKRIAVDYWLSYPGPSPTFEITAEEARAHGKHVFAKMQVCCSHELATVPYVPAPGLVYDKYESAKALGVEGVLQCWYFGNYPSIMSKAAGELSFTGTPTDKKAFLEYLAATYYGNTRAARVAKAWEHFEAGYRNYPINIMFSYYGPIHDGVVWELQLKPKDRILPRSWLLPDKPDGDRIHECLFSGHTLDEAIKLCELMRAHWSFGMCYLDEIKSEELYHLAECIGVLFDSGANILNFYKLRDLLGEGDADPLARLSEMRAIVYKEMENSRRMIDLCALDNRIGYHSEAEGFKFFPKKLRHRIESLRELLATEFKEVEERIDQGLEPLEFYTGRQNGRLYENRYILNSDDIDHAEYKNIPATHASVAFSLTDDEICMRLRGPRSTKYAFLFEYSLGHPSAELILKDGEFTTTIITDQHQSFFGERREEYLSAISLNSATDNEIEIYTIRIDRRKVGYVNDKPLRVRVEADGHPLVIAPSAVYRLGKPHGDPDDYEWLIPKKYAN